MVEAKDEKEMTVVLRIPIDYNRYGNSSRVRVSLLAEERNQVVVGARVIVTGDSVDDREAVVAELSDDKTEVILALI